MKHFTLLILILAFCLTASAQQRIFHKTEKDSLLFRVSSEYKEIDYEERMKSSHVIDGHRTAETRESFRLQRLFSFHAFKGKLDFKDWKSGETLMITLLVSKDKKVDYCFYEVRKSEMKGNRFRSYFDSISVSKEILLEKVLTQVLELPVVGMDVEYPYQFTFVLSPKLMYSRSPSFQRISSIEEAEKTSRPDTVTELNFSSLMLTGVPEVIYRFKNLKELDLSKNYLENFSLDFKKLKKLKMIDLSYNNLGDESLHFNRNRKLRILNLVYNQLTTIPPVVTKNRRLEDLLLASNLMLNLGQCDFKRMKRLKNLNLYYNQIKDLPPQVTRLKRLEILDLYHNRLKFLPKEIGRMKHLHTLAVSNNQLWKFPDEIGKLIKLKALYAHHNKLDGLPVLPPELKLVDIGYNQFRDFPVSLNNLTKLEELDFSFNQITEVPVGLLKITNLKTVFFGSNEFTNDREKAGMLDSLIVELEKKSVAAKR